MMCPDCGHVEAAHRFYSQCLGTLQQPLCGCTKTPPEVRAAASMEGHPMIYQSTVSPLWFHQCDCGHIRAHNTKHDAITGRTQHLEACPLQAKAATP